MHLFNLFQSALAFSIKGVYTIYFISPQFNTHRGRHIRCIKVHNVATYRKLTWPFYHFASDIASIHQLLHQFVALYTVTVLNGKCIFQKFFLRHGIHKGGVNRGYYYFCTFTYQVAQSTDSSVFVFAGKTFQRAQSKVTW